MWSKELMIEAFLSAVFKVELMIFRQNILQLQRFTQKTNNCSKSLSKLLFHVCKIMKVCIKFYSTQKSCTFWALFQVQSTLMYPANSDSDS